ncbi:SDR family NAD(P)-dependent oxidoreductase [Burkholderia thailandensis]|uniref:Oxidoreductase, short chain dehydrogenase/reductase family superfamily n=1 Tax=Burkholderia thailandensis (strain ATCC 700388 / DSM 13276 / CCUG 48851 / CIP 106301 / E264) TaxID=271848 RepID=Q2T8F0_BURTA|nr:SDR family NAD(P)-dependent oxidoreductase [Burkholderia thailandensis]ABC35839.1 oxidoreductase, short chain dehydrogenase/reductase family superfamily [Burkholderia thailandensis E264]AHI76022.1 gluconate 5-dehydrogenase [Burkholderia thailandensis 2002721723]AHI81184.1 gluconate 5-dehydrogenase [Burkholderia thailandensis E444]AIC89524.1 gluconate 5-dehydrogenase [Burkholderia thailandensis USAMRU Malaysia \
MANTLDKFRLDGRRALITGSGRGIGLTLARGLAEAGAAIVINDRDEERVAALAKRFRDDGFAADYAVFDVSEHALVRSAIDDFEARNGAIDILVNNAGIQRRAPLDAFEPGDWHALMRVNLDGVFNVAQAVARHMITRRCGKIINICSVQSELARPTIAPYAATKGAVRMLTKGMCADWARHGIQANGLAPGYFETELNRALVDDAAFSDWLCKRTPAGRWGRVDELCGAAIFLASAASDFVNGQTLFVDGGLTSAV